MWAFLFWVVAFVGPVIALLIALRAWRPEWFQAPSPLPPAPTGRTRVIMLVIALLVTLGTLPTQN